jgi:hypothetical protein
LKKDNAILKQRARVYGDFTKSLRIVGKMWTALLETHYQTRFAHDIPPHVAGAMMAGLKAYRACCPWDVDRDTYIDARNYLTGAEKSDERLRK